MRRIKVYSESLIKVWERYFINDTAKFIKATHLVREDLGKTYKEKNGTEWQIVGAMEGHEVVCRNVETRELFAISRWKVSSAMHPAKHAEWKNGKVKEAVEELVSMSDEPEMEPEVETNDESTEEIDTDLVEEESIEKLAEEVSEEELLEEDTLSAPIEGENDSEEAA